MVVPRFADYPHKIVNELGRTVRVPDFAHYFGGGTGGKFAGLKDFTEVILEREDWLNGQFKGTVYFACPKSSVLGTNLFESFMEKNGLLKFIESRPGEDEIVERFLKAEFTPAQKATFRFILSDPDAGHMRPAAARSSSPNEDAERAAFAGIFNTVLLPNCHSDLEVRVRQFETAIKLIFASTYSNAARTEMALNDIPGGNEQMAILLQNMVGRVWQLKDKVDESHPDGKRYIYHPEISFAGFSYNDYPVFGAKAKEGFARIAFGLGAGVVNQELGTAVKVQLRKPLTRTEMFDPKQAMGGAPRYFFALPFTDDDARLPSNENFFINRFGFEEHGNADMVGMHRVYYHDNSFKLHAPWGMQSSPVVTFSNLIKGNLGTKVTDILCALEKILREHYGGYVDFEGAMDFILDNGNWRTVVYLLQARTQVRTDMARVDRLPDVPGENLLMRLEGVIGSGKKLFNHLLLVPREAFSHLTSYNLAQKVKEMNLRLSELGDEGRYLLLAPGRIGSRDPSLGLPCDISYFGHATGIFEYIEGDWEPSQGTHMFENIVGARMTLGSYKSENLTQEKLGQFARLVSDEGGVQHYEFHSPMRLDIDDDNGCVIYRQAA